MDNPYDPPAVDQSAALPPTRFGPSGLAARRDRYGRFGFVMFGMLAAILGAFPVAALVGFVYRFPVPFSGYAHGLGAVIPSLLAVLLYGALGGFLIIAVLGALTGFLARRIAEANDMTRTRSLYLTLSLALLADLPPVLLLSVLDKIIGPW